MGETKQIRRLQTAAAFEYSDGPGTCPTISLTEHKEGGEFDLYPTVRYEGETAVLFLPHPSNPAFSIGVRVDSGAAGRLGRALVGVQRTLEGAPDDASTE